MYRATIGSERYVFPDLKTLLAKASPLRSGDVLAGIAAQSGEERVAAQYALAVECPPRMRHKNKGQFSRGNDVQTKAPCFQPRVQVIGGSTDDRGGAHS
jgi:ethanolamine ammonia-lyase large subunit